MNFNIFISLSATHRRSAIIHELNRDAQLDIMHCLKGGYALTHFIALSVTLLQKANMHYKFIGVEPHVAQWLAGASLLSMGPR